MLGLGASGTSATRLLRRHGVRVYASDSSTNDDVAAAAEALRADGAEVDLGRHDVARVMRAAAVIVSPGVPPDAPAVARARAAGIELLAEVDLAAQVLRGTRWIGITGTNGKTTT
ncbi:MAG: UDP-N-acetylmuramoyl-L-alanine--D-glutamate ligase, partial [Gemmatimonadales bacterium]